MITPRG
ncbi:hypothetical protein YPPY03_4420, partial [Yersinia pestis PY-03]